MAQIVIDVPAGADLTRISDAFTGAFNYQALIGGNPNPESKNQFTKRMIATYIKSVIRDFESNAAADTARANVAAQVAALNIT